MLVATSDTRNEHACRAGNGQLTLEKATSAIRIESGAANCQLTLGNAGSAIRIEGAYRAGNGQQMLRNVMSVIRADGTC